MRPRGSPSRAACPVCRRHSTNHDGDAQVRRCERPQRSLPISASFTTLELFRIHSQPFCLIPVFPHIACIPSIYFLPPSAPARSLHTFSLSPHTLLILACYRLSQLVEAVDAVLGGFKSLPLKKAGKQVLGIIISFGPVRSIGDDECCRTLMKLLSLGLLQSAAFCVRRPSTQRSATYCASNAATRTTRTW